MDKSETIIKDVLIFVSGLALIFFSQMPLFYDFRTLAEVIEILGIGMAGYAPIQLLIYLKQTRGRRTADEKFAEIFKSSIEVIDPKKQRPEFIAVDIEGCITPANRRQVDLVKLQRLRCYCEFVKRNTDYPPIVIYTGRSQGYVELLAQSLGMVEGSLELPFVIENGSALYYPISKKTESVLDDKQQELIGEARSILYKEFPGNAFEPKTYMVTINPLPGERVDNFRDKVTASLQQANIFNQLIVTNTATAVDITPEGVTKVSGLQKVVEYYSRSHSQIDFTKIVALGDHISDIPVLTKVGKAYCPAQNVDTQVTTLVYDKWGPDHIIDLPDIEFVLRVIEIECGVRISRALLSN